jgi:hypothetical protein
MLVHHLRRQTQIDPRRDVIGRMIADDEDRRGGIAEDVKGSGHAATLEALAGVRKASRVA